MNPVQAFAQTNLGQTLSSQETEAVCAGAVIKQVAHGEALFEYGAKGDGFYVILEGSFDVLLGTQETGTTVVANLGAGQVVGELEVMTQSLRIATLLAQGEAKVLEIPATHFLELVDQGHMGAVKIMTLIAKSLARRLAGVNQRIIEKKTGSVTAEKSAPAEPMEISTDDLIPVDDEDLEVLDKLWG